ncbi:MAG: zinc dependent phospholipase C family protein [Saprospiraceae bacterium]
MRRHPFLFLATAVIGTLLLLAAAYPSHEDWGFFGHRRINRLAVFTLDKDMMPFFRANVEYLTEHAVDPDKRRYATKHEAVRHYIDADHWGTLPFRDIPRDWTEALVSQAEFQLIDGRRGDTVSYRVDSISGVDFSKKERDWRDTALVHLSTRNRPAFRLPLRECRRFFTWSVLPQYYEDEIIVNRDSLAALWPEPLPARFDRFRVVDHFSEYGILPYHLLNMHKRIVWAFKEKDAAGILRLCAEMGHYVGDAHVPLHTTENYNGQMSGQYGIHGFWESRIPELFADAEYDFLVGKAEYIQDPRQYYWDIVLASHALVDSVLRTEKRLSLTYPVDRQFCFEDRLDITIRTQCEDYARAWDEAMQGMVEERMRAAVLSIGSVWYTAWVEAGQPDLRRLMTDADRAALEREAQKLEQEVARGGQLGRDHEG